MNVLGFPIPQPQLGKCLEDVPLLAPCKALNKGLFGGLGNRKAWVLVMECWIARHISVLPNPLEAF